MNHSAFWALFTQKIGVSIAAQLQQCRTRGPAHLQSEYTPWPGPRRLPGLKLGPQHSCPLPAHCRKHIKAIHLYPLLLVVLLCDIT